MCNVWKTAEEHNTGFLRIKVNYVSPGEIRSADIKPTDMTWKDVCLKVIDSEVWKKGAVHVQLIGKTRG